MQCKLPVQYNIIQTILYIIYTLLYYTAYYTKLYKVTKLQINYCINDIK